MNFSAKAIASAWKHRLWRRLPLWLRRRLRKRPPIEDLIWAWSAATWGWQIERKRWWRK